MTGTRVRSLLQSRLCTGVVLGLLLLLGTLVIAPGLAHADNPEAVQIYYVTLPEGDALRVLSLVNADAVTPAYTYYAIAIAVSNTYIYYDQWEDGYAADVANPTSGEIYSAGNLDGVQIWGNGESDDGCAPNINGVTFSCTDANDVLNAGNVIIPNNSVALTAGAAGYDALDQFSTVAYNNNDGMFDWSTSWRETGETPYVPYLDQFTTQAYNRSDGAVNWSTSPWTEENDDGSAATGTIYINTTSDHLRFRENSAAGDAIKRTANLSAYGWATLSFSIDGTNIDATDDLSVEISRDGSTWTELERFNGDPGLVTRSYDISSYISTTTTVRFIMRDTLETATGDGDYWLIDNVQIGVDDPAAGDILITGNQLRFTATEAGDSIYRGLTLPVSDTCATLSFTLGQSGIDNDNTDELRVDVSANGGTSYTTLETFNATGDAGSKSYSISAYASGNTRVRFYSVDPIEGGEYWTIDNVRVVWRCTYTRNPSTILFDARDKIGTSKGTAVTRAVWASGSNTLNAYAHEMYATVEWGTAYESPLGTNTLNQGPTAFQMFEYSGLSIMASQSNTTVQIDANADGTYESSVVLGEGETTLVEAILQGARVIADKPIQVVLLTGDAGSNYGTRDMNLLPVSTFGSSYWSPVGVSTDNGTGYTAGPTRLYLYNPSTNGSIYITCARYGVANITLGPIAARGVTTTDLIDNQGAHCYASLSNGTATTDTIFAIGTVDTAVNTGESQGDAWDWSFTLFPDSFLTTDALALLGLGRDPTYDDTLNNQNGSPLWVTTVCNTYLYVDWNNDGTADEADLNGNGNTTDTVNGISESTSESGMLVTSLQSVRLFEPPLDAEPYDQSGARIWTRTASGVGYGGTPGCKLAVAWGEDPRIASPARPGLDVGTSVPPFRMVEGVKTLTLKVDADNDGQLSLGDTATYSISVRNTGPTDVENVYVWDTVPGNATYVDSSTQKNLGSSWVNIPDDGSGTPYPLDDTTAPPPDGVYLGTLVSGAVFYVRFDVILGSSPTYEDLLNCDVAATGGGKLNNCAADLVASRDWGDLPDTYGTSSDADGPRHVTSALKLGSIFDIEPQGVPSTAANGDDGALSPDDEDGIQIAGTQTEWQAGIGSIIVTVTGGTGYLNAWMDFTNDTGSGAGSAFTDGNFSKTGGYDTRTVTSTTYSEHILVNVLVGPGVTVITFPVPPEMITDTATNQFYFRFRLSPSSGTIAPTGLVTGGEIEDYRFDLDDIPTRVVVSSFAASVQDGHVFVEWETSIESGTAGFFLYRQDPGTGTPSRDLSGGSGQWLQVNEGIVPAFFGTTSGGTYSLLDPGAQPGGTYTYKLQEVVASGQSNLYGPFEVTADQPRTAASALSNGEVPYERVQHPASLEKQPEQPEPNTGTDVPEELPEAPDAGVTLPPRMWLPLVSQPFAVEAAAAPGLAKLTVRQSGLYYLAGSDIAPALGLSVAQVTNLIKFTGLKLTNQGQTVAYLAASGNKGIYFYAESLSSPYAWDNVYWLKQAPGDRIGAFGNMVPAAVALTSFATSSHAEQNRLAVPGMVNDPALDYWMWDYVVAGNPSAGSRSFSLQTDGAAAAGPVHITARFLGVTDSNAASDHHAQIKLNGDVIGDAIWAGAVPYEVSLPVDPALLKDGSNTVEVVGLLDTGAPYSIFFVNSFDIRYQRAYRALKGALALSSVNDQAVTVYGFSSSNVMVFDLSNPKAPKRVSGIKVEASGGAYRVTFKPAAAGLRYWAVATAAVPRITTLAADTPSNLKGPNAANYVIITTASLAPPAQALAAYRRSRGLQVRVVDVQDIYDEFNGGVASPQAIQAFLAYAYAKWNPAPQYVLLAGSGSYDYKNYLGYGDCLVPPILVGTIDALSAADGRYADVVGNDGAPEIAVGRIPVLTPAEFQAYIAKIQAYEAADPTGWSKQALLLADNYDPDAGDFPADSDILAAGLPAGYTAMKVYLGPLSAAQARSQTLAALQAGVGVFNYIGHAGLSALAGENLLTSADVATLHNNPRLPFMSAATCTVGDYVQPGYRSLGVLLALQGDGGMGGVFSPTGSSFNTDGTALMARLFQNLFGGASARAGDATRAALTGFAAGGGPRYALDIYNLLGDPAMEMRWR